MFNELAKWGATIKVNLNNKISYKDDSRLFYDDGCIGFIDTETGKEKFYLCNELGEDTCYEIEDENKLIIGMKYPKFMNADEYGRMEVDKHEIQDYDLTYFPLSIFNRKTGERLCDAEGDVELELKYEDGDRIIMKTKGERME